MFALVPSCFRLQLIVAGSLRSFLVVSVCLVRIVSGGSWLFLVVSEPAAAGLQLDSQPGDDQRAATGQPSVSRQPVRRANRSWPASSQPAPTSPPQFKASRRRPQASNSQPASQVVFSRTAARRFGSSRHLSSLSLLSLNPTQTSEHHRDTNSLRFYTCLHNKGLHTGTLITAQESIPPSTRKTKGSKCELAMSIGPVATSQLSKREGALGSNFQNSG